LGAFVIGVLVDGLILMGYTSFLQNVIKGIVIVLAVFIDSAQNQMQERIALRRQATVAAAED
jgi:erythritol transport system permease protein